MKKYFPLFWLSLTTTFAMASAMPWPDLFYEASAVTLIFGGILLAINSFVYACALAALTICSCLLVLLDPALSYVVVIIQVFGLSLFVHARTVSHLSGTTPKTFEYSLEQLRDNCQRMMMVSVIYIESILYFISKMPLLPVWVSRLILLAVSVIALAADIVYYFHLRTGSTFVVIRDDRPVPSVTQVCPEPPADDSCSPVVLDRAHMREIYMRVDAYMEAKKPYLDDNLTLEVVAKGSYTNKTYVSRCIGIERGINFCQYVNEKRVLYSMRLLESDHSLKICDVSAQSGFHSQSTYNAAFRAMNGMTPTEWVQREQVRCLSNSRAQEREDVSHRA